MKKLISSNLGYPRIGEKREWKKALENHWKGIITEEELIQQTTEIRLEGLQKQKDAGIDLIPVGDFTLYDHVLDTSFMFGMVPERFKREGYTDSLDTYFAIARGSKHAVASEMTKWFNTNYHYIVPEFDQVNPTLVENRPLRFYQEAKEKLDIDGKPVILGPLTYLKIGKGPTNEGISKLLEAFVPLYKQILKELQDAGVKWVQIDEPIFVTKLSTEELFLAKVVYEELNQAAPELNILLQTYFDHPANYKEITSLSVQAIGLDFVHGNSLKQIKEFGFPKNKILAAGIINGRNVWQANLEEKIALLNVIRNDVEVDQFIIQPSCSLLHVPITKRLEQKMDAALKDGLSFADEKLKEIVILTKGFNEGIESVSQEIKENKEALARFTSVVNRDEKALEAYNNNIEQGYPGRKLSFSERIKKQQEVLKLPLLPTTTIGSLPQTAETRQIRTKWRKGEVSNEQYEKFINESIEKWIQIQEDLELDVLVHGEFERTDMVEYFGEKLNGFTTSKYGWVQSYGSRCVKPPLIYKDVNFDKPMTVKETVYAQTLTEKPVKGMLTGPVTIINWSFVNEDVSRTYVQNQIAIALQEEVKQLEKNKIKIIQVDEPALREGLPLNEEKKKEYLEAAVYAFRLATASVKDSTQIHTHMCYSDFEEIFDAIDELDADVISIETSRSHGELISYFNNKKYTKEIGLGVYDIHSPRIPSVKEMKENITKALQTISPRQFWINPDCGLKTRNKEETIRALQNMVNATNEIRKEQHALK
ncbi:5-methyltetrahydropteroyltriglutamate--homocysteine S-methyltransferase [Oceanobacillus senegalensis]|uniref:5-methyltetrahydropteroyltriglutamate-- homocysteine S-methyltransferase n=1 Tax=Oceanobacillus senegalensis TaxID=1936063 RepID=UPI000A30B482|nr:5-methyltetrahydropteroyltriglutamate--homocysteine S-methyltransferase [Oceanobacillus senegalensis]